MHLNIENHCRDDTKKLNYIDFIRDYKIHTWRIRFPCSFFSFCFVTFILWGKFPLFITENIKKKKGIMQQIDLQSPSSN